MRHLAALLSGALAIAGPATVASAQPFQILDIDREVFADDVNVHLQVIGGDRSNASAPAVLWSPSSGTRHLPHVPSGFYLRINDRGVIGGIRRLGAKRAAFLTNIEGSHYEQAELPLERAPLVVRLTNSDILLLMTESFESGRFVYRHHALYRGRLYDLNQLFGIAPPAVLLDIDDAGTVLGQDPSAGTFVRTLDGVSTALWPDRLINPVGVISSGGHVVAWGLGPQGVTVNIRAPDGAVARVAFPRTLWRGLYPLSVNRHGAVVGSYTRFEPPPVNARVDSFTFVIHGGELTDLESVSNVPNARLTALKITDGGAILAAVHNPGWELVSYWVLLLPTAPSPPSALQFSVHGQTVSLSWERSFLAEEYVVEAGSSTGLADLFNASVGGQRTISGAVPPGRYYVRVRAKTQTGVSPPSSEVVIDVP